MTTDTPKQIGVVRIYLKDLSFESPLSPQVFETNLRPKVKADIQCHNSELREGLHEVVLQLTLEGATEDQTVFIVEVEQAGLFAIKGISDQELNHVLNVFCPNVLFPYARAVIDQAVVQGGLPPLMLGPINFETLYSQHRPVGGAH